MVAALEVGTELAAAVVDWLLRVRMVKMFAPVALAALRTAAQVVRRALLSVVQAARAAAAAAGVA